MAIEIEELELVASEIARRIGGGLEDAYGKHKVGFALLVFDFGEGGSMTWVSNANREDMVAALREMFEKLSH